MTREEAIELIEENKEITDNDGYLAFEIEIINFNSVRDIINNIYDDFESRLCEYFKGGYCYNKDICNWHSIKENEGVFVEYTYF